MRDALQRYFTVLAYEGDSGASSGSGNDANHGGNSGKSKDEGGFKPITSQEDLDDILTRRLNRARKTMESDIREQVKADIEAEIEAEEAKKKGDLQKQLESAEKTIEKLNERIGEYEAKEQEAERLELRAKIAKQFKLDDDAHDLIIGETEEDMKDSAKKLAKYAKKADDTGADEKIGQDQGRTRGDRSPDRKEQPYDSPKYWPIPGRN